MIARNFVSFFLNEIILFIVLHSGNIVNSKKKKNIYKLFCFSVLILNSSFENRDAQAIQIQSIGWRNSFSRRHLRRLVFYSLKDAMVGHGIDSARNTETRPRQKQEHRVLDAKSGRPFP